MGFLGLCFSIFAGSLMLLGLSAVSIEIGNLFGDEYIGLAFCLVVIITLREFEFGFLVQSIAWLFLPRNEPEQSRRLVSPDQFLALLGAPNPERDPLA
jgi:hypothetical protein